MSHFQRLQAKIWTHDFCLAGQWIIRKLNSLRYKHHALFGFPAKLGHETAVEKSPGGFSLLRPSYPLNLQNKNCRFINIKQVFRGGGGDGGYGRWGRKKTWAAAEKKKLFLFLQLFPPPQVERKLLLFPRKWGERRNIIVPQIIGRYWLNFPPSNMLQRQPGISQIMIIKISSSLYFSKLRSSPPPSTLHILSLNLMKDFLRSFHCHHHFLTPPLPPLSQLNLPHTPPTHSSTTTSVGRVSYMETGNFIKLLFHECFENSILEQRNQKALVWFLGGLLYEIDPKKRRAKVALAQKVLSALHHPSVSHILNQPPLKGGKRKGKSFRWLTTANIFWGFHTWIWPVFKKMSQYFILSPFSSKSSNSLRKSTFATAKYKKRRETKVLFSPPKRGGRRRGWVGIENGSL